MSYIILIGMASTIVVELALYAAYVNSKASGTSFFTEFLKFFGLNFWFEHPPAQLLLSAFPSMVFVFLFYNISWGTEVFKTYPLWSKSAHTILMVLAALPLINAILYGLGRVAHSKGLKKKVIMINTLWFALFFLAIFLVIILLTIESIEDSPVPTFWFTTWILLLIGNTVMIVKRLQESRK